MRKYLMLMAFVIGLFIVPYLVHAEDVTDCRALNESKTYDLINDVDATDTAGGLDPYPTCFQIENENITLDCHGYSIFSNKTNIDGFQTTAAVFNGALYPNTNTTIQNCNIYGHGWGIYAQLAQNSNIINNTMHDMNTAIYIDGAGTINMTINNNLIAGSYGIHAQGDLISSNITGNFIIVGDTNIGIWFASTDDNNRINNNIIISTNPTDDSIAIKLGSGEITGNLIYNNFFNTTQNIVFEGTPELNFFNTTKQPEERVYGTEALIGGNYWADPTGTGYSETCNATSDRFCDASFTWNGNNIDYLPLTNNAPQNYNITQGFPSSVLEGDTVTYNALIQYNPTKFASISGNLIRNGIQYNGIVHSISFGLINITTTLIIHTNADIYELTHDYDHFWNITLTNINGTKSEDVSAEGTQTVNSIILTDCNETSVSQTKAITFNLLDEDTFLPVTGNMAMNHLLLGSKLYNFTFTNVTTASICIYPYSNPIFVQDKGFVQYGAENYNTRTTQFYGYLTTSEQIMNLYLSNLTSQVLVFVRTQKDDKVTNATVQVLKYQVGLNETFIMVTQCVTDEKGQCMIALNIKSPNRYSFIVLKNNTVQTQTSSAEIACIPFDTIVYCPPYPVVIRINDEIPFNIYESFGKIQWNCFVNDATNTLICTVTDISQLANSLSFITQKMGALNFTNLCQSTVYATAATFTCDLGNRTGNLYRYDLTGYISNVYVDISGWQYLDYRTQIIQWGTIGYFLALIIILTLFFAGIDNPAKAIIYAELGVIFSNVLGLLPLEWSSIVAFTIIIAAIVWKVRS